MTATEMPFDLMLTNRRDPLQARRFELFRLAAPVFRQHGYRGATMKALAFACHLRNDPWSTPRSAAGGS